VCAFCRLQTVGIEKGGSGSGEIAAVSEYKLFSPAREKQNNSIGNRAFSVTSYMEQRSLRSNNRLSRHNHGHSNLAENRVRRTYLEPNSQPMQKKRKK